MIRRAHEARRVAVSVSFGTVAVCMQCKFTIYCLSLRVRGCKMRDAEGGEGTVTGDNTADVIR